MLNNPTGVVTLLNNYVFNLNSYSEGYTDIRVVSDTSVFLASRDGIFNLNIAGGSGTATILTIGSDINRGESIFQNIASTTPRVVHVGSVIPSSSSYQTYYYGR